MRADDGLEWVTLDEASQRYGIPAGTLRKWRHRGKVITIRTGDGLWFLAADVAAAEHATRGKYAHQRRSRARMS